MSHALDTLGGVIKGLLHRFFASSDVAASFSSLRPQAPAFLPQVIILQKCVKSNCGGGPCTVRKGLAPCLNNEASSVSLRIPGIITGFCFPRSQCRFFSSTGLQKSSRLHHRSSHISQRRLRARLYANRSSSPTREICAWVKSGPRPLLG
jgi:hypothetical protein